VRKIWGGSPRVFSARFRVRARTGSPPSAGRRAGGGRWRPLRPPLARGPSGRCGRRMSVKNMQCDQRGGGGARGCGAEQDECAAHPVFPVALGSAYVWWLKVVGSAQGESNKGAQRRWGVSRVFFSGVAGHLQLQALTLCIIIRDALGTRRRAQSIIDIDCPRKFHLPQPVSTGWRARLFLPPTHPPVAD
jgi:hypothetical protein